MYSNKKYILVGWPEIQDFMLTDRFDECFLLTGNNAPDSTYAVPEDLCNDVIVPK